MTELTDPEIPGWLQGLTWSEADRAAVIRDLGREPRGVVGVGARAIDGHPLVLVTAPRLPDGTPFPTTFYLTDALLTAACSRLEAEHFMDILTNDLEGDPDFAAAHRAAHQDYLLRRHQVGTLTGIGDVAETKGISAGGLPTRVKCLHALLGHSLVAGPGVNPAGDRALAEAQLRGLIPRNYRYSDARTLAVGDFKPPESST